MVDAKRACASSALDFDNLPYIQSAVENSQFVEYSCFTALPKEDESSLEFRIDKTDSYSDLSRAHLYVQVQILNKDGTDVLGTDPCTFINNIGYALFDSVDLFISDQKVTKPESFYPWWTYVYNLLYYSKPATEAYLEAGNLWYPDTAAQFDSIELLGALNQGMKDRHSSCGDSRKVWLSTKVLLNTQLDRLLPNQAEIMLRFNRSPTNLCLLAEEGNEYKIRILDAKLHVNRVKLFDGAQRELENN